jgi:N-ethylmaleimide reductase
MLTALFATFYCLNRLTIKIYNMNSNPLLTPITIGTLDLPNRMIMAPLTRRRAGAGNIPTALMPVYYAQRASAGLIISEATPISPQAIGYNNLPGIFTNAQVEGWKPVTAAVHEKGGRIFMQLWHVGRISHSLFQPGHALPVAPSAISAGDSINTPDGHRSMEVPHALERTEIAGIVEDYRKAAENAVEAGFDGVEIHGANAYLIDQFLHDSSNQRTDAYGGSLENRTRFALEVVQAVSSVWGSERVGIRLSPSNVRYGMDDTYPAGLFTYLIEKLNAFNLAYLHLVEPMLPLDNYPHMIREVARYFRPVWKGRLITAGNYNQEKGEAALRDGIADMVAYGRLFISNPDLPERFAQKAPLTEPDVSTFYAGGEKGYTDYPALQTKEETNRHKAIGNRQ